LPAGFFFQAADGTSLDGVMVGRGPAGVVLAHQHPSDLCGAWPFADYLAKRALRALAIDLRCFGRSACPEGDARGRVVDDLAAAVAELRRRGVTRVALVGASMGGAAVLIAGTRVQPPVAAVVSLSGEPDPTSLVGGIPLHAGAVERLTVPTMLVVATNDGTVSVAETRAMYQAVKTGDQRLEVLSGDFDGGHGWALLKNPATGEQFGPVANKVAAFPTTHTRGWFEPGITSVRRAWDEGRVGPETDRRHGATRGRRAAFGGWGHRSGGEAASWDRDGPRRPVADQEVDGTGLRPRRWGPATFASVASHTSRPPASGRRQRAGRGERPRPAAA
jgi:dienelactone hydrolase